MTTSAHPPLTRGRRPRHAGRHATRRAASGFTLVELLILLALLAVFVLIADEVFAVAFRTTRASESAQNRGVVVERMIASIRRDVWNAQHIEVDAAGQLTIQLGDGSSVAWTAAADQPVRRTPTGASAGARETYAPQVSVTFQARNGGLLLKVEDAPSHQSESLVLLSQPILAGGGAP